MDERFEPFATNVVKTPNPEGGQLLFVPPYFPHDHHDVDHVYTEDHALRMVGTHCSQTGTLAYWHLTDGATV
jgi:hypothetical protein